MQRIESKHAALVRRWIEFLETNTVPDGLFSGDVQLDLSVPLWRLRRQGRDELAQVRVGSHPWTGTVPTFRVDDTATGFVIEWEERWSADGQDWYCREMARADVTHGLISAISIYCTGDWDEATQQRHAADEG
jgi:hypothetical protein